MPTSAGNGVRTIADIVQVLTKCSATDANAAELEICKSPAGIATLAMACGASTAAVGVGGKLIVGGAATGGTTAVAGLILGGVGVIAAKKYCSAMIRNGGKAGE